MKQRILSLLLSAILLMSLAFPAMAVPADDAAMVRAEEAAAPATPVAKRPMPLLGPGLGGFSSPSLSGYTMNSWFTESVAQAQLLGLIPPSINGDLTTDITRQEFAAICVSAYRLMSGVELRPASPNPFTDTNDPDVLRAYGAGFTNGVSDTTFGANDRVTREMGATMLGRVYKRFFYPTWSLDTDVRHTLFSYSDFTYTDDSSISSWARDSVYFLSENGILEGPGGGFWDPQSYLTKEQAIAISLRIVTNLSGRIVMGRNPDENLDQRLAQEGAQTGDITVSMIWNTMDDLDLHIKTPSGDEIYFANKQAGGGTLDVDMQAPGHIVEDPETNNPVENIYFPTPNPGEYRIWVKNYQDRTPDSSSTATVRVAVGGQAKIFHVTLNGTGDEEDVITFTYRGQGQRGTGS